MGKHNGKARHTGLKVGAALANKAKKAGKGVGVAAHEVLHTTDHEQKNIQSVLEVNDLTELMDMAVLAEREFLGERQQVVVLHNKVKSPLELERDAVARREAEDRNRHRLRLPRRPHWTPSMSADELDHRERTSFVEWRRQLAAVEEDESLVLTPFEKNLEMWRQLWRVLERSDFAVQVVDARDPLFYWSKDMAEYARQIEPSKASMVLLNKADLLTPQQRSAWADHFDSLGLSYAFWSAKAATDAQALEQREGPEAAAALLAAAAAGRGCSGGPGGWEASSSSFSSTPGGVGKVASKGGRGEDEEDVRCSLLGVDELLDLLEERARQAVASRGEAAGSVARVTVGLTGYPNVGKSSTINALYGSKKAAVAPTPGKTKHFQTLNVTDGLVLCDCPGLVLPRFAASKADMVAAGVLPIDRLTNVRLPVQAVASRVPRAQFEQVYGIKLPPPSALDGPFDAAYATAVELLRSLSLSRGWVVSAGKPDEARAGRLILRDYCQGKLVYARWPPGREPAAPAAAASTAAAASAAAARSGADGGAGSGGAAVAEEEEEENARRSRSSGGIGPQEQEEEGAAGGEEQQAGGSDGGGGGAAAVAGSSGGGDGSISGAIELSVADLELMDDMGISGKPAKAKRPEYKFHKKAARSKGNRGKNEGDEASYDGSGFCTGRKGGLVRA